MSTGNTQGCTGEAVAFGGVLWEFPGSFGCLSDVGLVVAAAAVLFALPWFCDNPTLPHHVPFSHKPRCPPPPYIALRTPPVFPPGRQEGRQQ
jgi:hypothetical protein